MDENRNHAHRTLPDDPEQSMYRYIIVAAKRARQLQAGAKPVIPSASRKSTAIATEEARRGLVKYELTHNPEVEPAPEVPAGEETF